MGDANLKNLGLALLLCSFFMSSYNLGLLSFPKETACLCRQLTAADAEKREKEMAEECVEIFQKLGDDEHVAEAYMVLGLQFKYQEPQHLQYLQRGLLLCLKSCGRFHPLASKFQINIGIFYEDSKDYVQSYKYFKEWNEINQEVCSCIQ
eukprot:m.23932 g.23932  ORF g.23932 m.23932 type:complete len:150 (+) comp28552_c0_seq3:748-1197(+)